MVNSRKIDQIIFISESVSDNVRDKILIILLIRKICKVLTASIYVQKHSPPLWLLYLLLILSLIFLSRLCLSYALHATLLTSSAFALSAFTFFLSLSLFLLFSATFSFSVISSNSRSSSVMLLFDVPLLHSSALLFFKSVLFLYIGVPFPYTSHSYFKLDLLAAIYRLCSFRPKLSSVHCTFLKLTWLFHCYLST